MADAGRGWIDNDELFFSELLKGREAELTVAAKLLGYGMGVYVPPFQVHTKRTKAEAEADRLWYADSHDLWIGHPLAKRWTPIEVKSSSRDFTCIEDFPFSSPYVDTVSGWEAKKPKPLAIVVLSQTRGGCIVIPASSLHKWLKIRGVDHVRHIEDTWYACPKEECKTLKDLADWYHKQYRYGQAGGVHG